MSTGYIYAWLESSKLIPSECTWVKFDLGNSYKLIVKEHSQEAIMRSEIQQYPECVLYCVACIHPQKRGADNIIAMSTTHVKGLVMLLV